MDANLLQQIRDRILNVTSGPIGTLNTSIYLQEIRDALLGVTTPSYKYGTLNENIYLQQIRNAILGVPDGQFGNLSSAIYLQEIRDAFNAVTGIPQGSLDEDVYLAEILGVASGAPTVTITSNGSYIIPVPIIITFSEVVTGFVVGDITIGSGSLANFATADNKTFTVDWTTNNSEDTMDIAAGVCTDAVGSGNLAAAQFSLRDNFIFNSPDGVVSDDWAGSGNMVIASKIAHINPVDGVEILPDGDLEGTYTAGFCVALTKNGSPIVAQSAVVQHGAKAQQFKANAQVDFARIGLVVPTDNTHYVFKVHKQRNSGSTNKAAIAFQQTSGYNGGDVTLFMDANFILHELTSRAQGTGTFQLYPIIERGTTNFEEVIIDNCSFKTLTHANLFKFVQASTPNVKVVAKISFPHAHLRGGIVLCADSPTNPQNAIIAWIDRTTIRVEKLLAGVFSILYASTSSAPYVDWAALQLAFDGSNVTLSYNGLTIGTPIAVADAGIINNTYHGVYALSSQVLFSSFGVTPVAQSLTLPARNSITVTSDATYNGFPGLVKVGSTLIAVYRKGTAHQAELGVIVKKTSTDNGATWSAETTIATDGTYDLRDPSIALLSNGNLYLTYSRATVLSVHVDIQAKISTDNGGTWGSPIAVTTGFTSYAVNTSPVIELASGNLLIAYYGRDSGNTFDSSRCSVSTDDGATWGSEVVIANGQTASKNYHEPELLLLSGTNVLCLIRNSTDAYIATSLSTDDGGTWAAVANKFVGNSVPHSMKMVSGRIVTAYRIGTSGVRIASSPDGTNWYPWTHPVDLSLQSMYSPVVELSAGLIGCFYSLEVSASRADIYFITIPESVLTQV